jgi:heme exporter protein D
MGTINICNQVDTNTVNPTWLKALPIIDYLMLGGAIILSLTGGFVGYNQYSTFVGRGEYNNATYTWTKVGILLISIFILWILVTLICNAIFYDQVQDNLIDTSFKDFVFVANFITFSISFVITSPAWGQAGGIA